MSNTSDTLQAESSALAAFVGISSLNAEDASLAVAAAGVAAYRWKITEDVLDWTPEAAGVLRRPAEWLASGRRFANLLDPDNLTSRYDAVMNSVAQDGGEGVPYQIEYQLKGDAETGIEAVWVEDTGRWFGDNDGRPQMACGVIRIVTARHNRDQELSTLSHTDTLTGLMNRNRLDEALAGALEAANAGSTTSAFAVAAIRNLDIVNDAYGFEVADEVIKALAQRLRSVMRVGDGIGRYSGSKFGIILNKCAEEDLPVAMERLLNAARDNVIETSKGPVWALLSIGAVILPTSVKSSVEARAYAEESLSAALRLSSDSFVAHQPSEANATDRMVNARCAAEIVECLRNDRFQLAFQPMVSAATGEVNCHEALLRMRDEAGELVTAGHLVPVAERLGLIRLVDRSVVQLALETLHRHGDARLSVNVSATTANDPRWNGQIIEMIETARAVAERLTVEITETTALTDLSSALIFLDRLRQVGCCVAIDDFGAGFTSFRNLRDLPIDVIKLDGSYCCNLTTDPENAHFSKTLIDMAHHFGIRTVAEWVETEADAEILKSLGIDFLQGNFIGLPSVVPPWTVSETPSFNFDHTGNTDHMGGNIADPITPAAEILHAMLNEVSPDHSEHLGDFELTEESPEDQPAVSADELLVETNQPAEIDAEGVAVAQETESIFNEMEESLAKLREALNVLSYEPPQSSAENPEERLAG